MKKNIEKFPVSKEVEKLAEQIATMENIRIEGFMRQCFQKVLNEKDFAYIEKHREPNCRISKLIKKSCELKIFPEGKLEFYWNKILIDTLLPKQYYKKPEFQTINVDN
jgi:hypothetical protein